MVEGAPLLREYGSKAHRGFESLPLRQHFKDGPAGHYWNVDIIDWIRTREEGLTKSPGVILNRGAERHWPRRGGAQGWAE